MAQTLEPQRADQLAFCACRRGTVEAKNRLRPHRVGPLIPVTPVDLVPALAGGDTGLSRRQRTYEEWAQHYATTILPAQLGKAICTGLASGLVAR